ncbi:PAS domain S-box-containing protein [Sphingomonas jejuensis]|uniref:histidine kinase n=1 Tax=Sphingomonas jejuensis TaxID=904715 RepID=A0ABX0XP53_9SPHN|nr:PAS domain S-box protein [Sphingomonas jejuensis]NJC35173.1 PAS domain S-box-containing protein [Sphingomonas jejuensis]
MTNSVATAAGRKPEPLALALGVLATAAVFGSLAYAGLELTRSGSRIAALWLPNAVLVGILLRTRTNSCPWFVAACFLANVAANIAGGDPLTAAAALALANAVEVMVAVAAMRMTFGRNPEVADLRTLGGFLAVFILAPVISGIIAAAALAAHGRLTPGTYASWVISDGLSLVMLTPLILVAVDAWRMRRRPTRAQLLDWVLLTALALVGSTMIFAQERFSLLFLTCPVVIVAAFRGGIAGTAAATAIVAVVASTATMLGHGPIMLVEGDVSAKIMVFQMFLATAFAMGLPVAAALAGREALRRQLWDAQTFTTTMLDNVQEIIFRTDAAGRWIFLNPAWETLTGYAIEESLGWSTTRLLHPDDRQVALETYPMITSGEVAETTLRQRFYRADGECRHIEVRVRRLVDATGTFIGTTGNIRDVSEAVQREAALADSEARFRCMAEAAPVGIFRADADGQITYLNRLWSEKTGMPLEESLGSGWRRALVDPTIFDGDPTFAGFKTPGDVRRRTLKLRGAGGQDLWMETVNAAEFDEAGTLTGFVGVLVDVTDQRAALDALSESERRFQTLANLAPAGIFRTDVLGNCAYVNDAWMRITGFDDDSWKGDGWAVAVHPDDRQRIYDAWANAVATRSAYREEWRWQRSDGSVAWVDGVGRPEVDESGTIAGFVGVIMDITERRMAEAKLAERDAQLELLATNATDAVFRIGLDGRCLYASPSVRRVTGFNPEEIVGRQMLARFHPEDCANATDTFLSLASGAVSNRIVAYRSEVAGDPGRYQWLEANCGLVRDADGRPAEIIASIRDVTHKKALEEDLRQARATAENAATAKAAFLANMSHEIRTPMNGVLGFTELLASSDLNEEQRHQVQLITESGRAMMRLLNDILDISKIESGQMQVANEPIDLRHKLRSCARLMEPVAVSKGIHLAIDVDPRLPATILGDPLRIRQVLLNLIGNAIKFTEHGSVTVKVTAAPGDGTVSIAVIDTGVGIPADRLSTIFNQFAQADTSIARRFGGTGLGLSISSELARLMGGSISVTSELGRGSTFVVRLPLVVTAGSPVNDAGAAPVEEPAPPAAKRARVLIAEDHDINQMLMLSLAGSAGFDAAIACDGAEAVMMVQEAQNEGAPYDLVFMDMQMPVVDGLEATRRLRGLGFSADQLPIVALTANAYQDDVTACRKAGMQAHLSKPVRVREVKDVIARYVTRLAPAAADVADRPAPARSTGDLYGDRRDATLAAVAAAVRAGRLDGHDLTQIMDLLHKLAGTAGFFGEGALGTAAGELEERLIHAAPDAAFDVLADGWERLSRAA